MRFSDRVGATAPRDALQIENIDDALKNGLWECLIEHYMTQFYPTYERDTRFKAYIKDILVNFAKTSSDKAPEYHSRNIKMIHDFFYGLNWYDTYNFIEFMGSINSRTGIGNDDAFRDQVNFFLEREKSGYRFINGQLTPVTDAVEIASIQRASQRDDKFSGARAHIRQATLLFSQKPNPDYRNTIKESILSIESAARTITGDEKATLGAALKVLETHHNLHPALKESLVRLYGYTSDEGGIRHAMLDDEVTTEREARFMLVCCSAFLNYLVTGSA